MICLLPGTTEPETVVFDDTYPGYALYDAAGVIQSHAWTDGVLTATLNGGLNSDNPDTTAMFLFPWRNADGDLVDPDARKVGHLLGILRRYPSLKGLDDVVIRVGVCTFANPTDAAFNAGGIGMKIATVNGQPRAEVMRVSAGGAPAVTVASTNQPGLRILDFAAHLVGSSQNLIDNALVGLDGSNARTTIDVIGINSLLQFGVGVQVAWFLQIGRINASNLTASTLRLELKAKPIVEWDASVGDLTTEVRNAMALGDSTVAGTGWNLDALGELYGWRYKLDIMRAEDPRRCATLRWYGSVVSGNNLIPLSGRNQHEGHSGFTTAQIDAAIIGYLDAIPAGTLLDLIVICLLTNDAQNGVSWASAKASYNSMVAKCRAHAKVSPTCRIVATNIQPLGNVTHEANAAVYRAGIAAGELVGIDEIVDVVTGYTVATHSGDNVHPDNEGYDLFTERIHAATWDV